MKFNARTDFTFGLLPTYIIKNTSKMIASAVRERERQIGRERVKEKSSKLYRIEGERERVKNVFIKFIGNSIHF